MIVSGRSVSKKKPGRPRKDEGEADTRLIRVFPDIAEMISWITEMQDIKTANLVDPILRPAILMRYEQIKPEIEAMKKLKASAAKKAQDSAG